MELQKSSGIEVIALAKKATLTTIMQDIGRSPELLLEDIQQQGVRPEGPMIFVYRGCDGDMEKPFDLQICQPVKAADQYSGQYEKTELEPFQYVERRYVGKMADMGAKGYEPFIADVEKSGLKMGTQCREIYTQYIGPDSEENITELQLGIQ
ncbi:hypothetical protein [Alkalimarinus coralli]|uniref:hypothetical protein n=1 Tax=Alkalimarinus coralli TaxID=2935863 RepID=UPI00202AFF02|nr:hypothetical protein [Alkalimarinus coralli]